MFNKAQWTNLSNRSNDRSFDIQGLQLGLLQWLPQFQKSEKENELSATFEDVEQLFYRQRYRDFCDRTE